MRAIVIVAFMRRRRAGTRREDYCVKENLEDTVSRMKKSGASTIYQK